MGKAILITGFHSWGKTTLIYELFQQRRFNLDFTYPIANVNAQFVVESHSNDDDTEDNYVARLQERMRRAPGRNNDLLCALCPTRERNNDSNRILQHHLFEQFDDIYLFVLKFKWDHHAKLTMPTLQTYFKNSRVNIVVIDADTNVEGDQERLAARHQQTLHELSNIF